MKKRVSKDSLREVRTMRYEESFFPDEHLPTRPGLKVIRTNDPDFGFTEDEIQDRYEFIRCYLMKGFKVLMMIPKPDYKDDFFIPDVDVTHEGYSAFNTQDFHTMHRPFKRRGYALQKILDRVYELALQHSSTTHPVCIQWAYERYIDFLASIYTEDLERLARQLHLEESYQKRSQAKRKIGKINREIAECRKKWERYAPSENWDR